VQQVERNLQEAFKEKNENRVLDIWVDLPPQLVNQYMDKHLGRMTNEMNKMDMALRSKEKLVECIGAMEQLMLKPSVVTQNTVKRAKMYANPSTMGNFMTQTVPKKLDYTSTNNKASE
jgi:RecA/RadA recombinase